MCLGAIHWRGVRRLVFAAERGVLRAEAVAVLSLYRERGGLIYNR